jgi:hypothetical protein
MLLLDDVGGFWEGKAIALCFGRYGGRNCRRDAISQSSFD